MMADSCCPGNTMAIPAVPTISGCSKGGSFSNAISLPSFCRSRTWQLVTCQDDCQLSSSVPVSREPVACQPSRLPEMSCPVGFVCQPICSCTTSCDSGTDQAPRPGTSCQPSCLESAGDQTKCFNASPCHQNAGQESACTSGQCQAACGQEVCCDVGTCQPSCSEVTSCAETPCPPVICKACSCQPTCCQTGSCQPVRGEGQPCKSVYYQPICYVLEPCQPVPCMPVPCQSLTCMFSSCCQTCQPAPSISFFCQPVANCQSPCFVKSSLCGTRLPGQPTCGFSTSDNQSACKSPSCQPPCCVTGLGTSSDGGSSCCRLTSPSVCKASPCWATS